MQITTNEIKKTSNGYPFIDTKTVAATLENVSRWGLYVSYGIRGESLVAEINEVPVAIYISKQSKEVQKVLKKVRKNLSHLSSDCDYIRKQAKSAAIIWDKSGFSA